ncbi:ABC transporter permease [Lysinimonas soli]|uniref:ABC transporter permease n=1 Tax=Lysinimonas soli TaxID=1074233 RepID=A0ABW0NPY4_9MICO
MLQNILLDTFVTGLPLIPLVLGVYLIMRIREDFDLTVEGSFALGGGVSAISAKAGINPAVAILLGALAGAVAGLITSVLHLALRIPVLLAGLVMSMALFSIVLNILGTPTASLIGVTTIFSWLPPGDIYASVELVVIVAALLTLFALFLRTEIGLALRASGQSARMVRSQGVNDNGLLVLSLAIANALSALSGGLLTQIQGFADVNMGIGMFIAAVGAVMLGVLLLNPSGSKVLRIVLAVAIGGLVYRLILVAALRFGLPAGDLKGVTALTLIVAIAAQTYVVPMFTRMVRRGIRTPQFRTGEQQGAK